MGKLRIKHLISIFQIELAIFLIALGVWRFQVGPEWRGFVSFGVAFATIWIVIDRYSFPRGEKTS